jgi:PAS domain-containing protein
LISQTSRLVDLTVARSIIAIYRNCCEISQSAVSVHEAPLERIGMAIAEADGTKAGSRNVEEQFRSFFDNGVGAAFVADPLGNIEAANTEACRLFGRTEEELCRIGRAGLIDPAEDRLAGLLKEQ